MPSSTRTSGRRSTTTAMDVQAETPASPARISTRSSNRTRTIPTNTKIASVMTKPRPSASARRQANGGRGKNSKSNKGEVTYKNDVKISSEVSDEDDDDEEDDGSSDDYQDGEKEEDEKPEADESEDSLESDDLDTEDEYGPKNKSKQSKKEPSPRSAASKRKRGIGNQPAPNKKTKIPKKQSTSDGAEYSDYTDLEDDSDFELEEGQAIAGRIFPAPTSGHVPPGCVSRNTFKFLANLQIPERNDREWFKLHDPAYRVAEKEWVAFVAKSVSRFRQVDDELPAMPPKDLIHRIYRDVRFSNDKTPYKKNFSMSISRSGRKGIWAGYFVSIQPKGRTIIAGGIWQPGKNEMASIRRRIVNDVDSLKSVIEKPEFVELFGPARPDGRGKGERSNVFGHEDMLKTSPQGWTRDHPSIDYLRLRSVAVVHTFEDSVVLSPNFMDKLMEVVAVIRPLVHWINDAIMVPNENDE